MFYRFARYKNDSIFKYLIFLYIALKSPNGLITLIFKTLYFLLQAYPMNLLRAFMIICS